MRIELKILNEKFYGHNYSKPGNALGYTGPIQIYESKLPSYATPGSAAIDLVCTQDVVLYPQERKMIPTGIAIWKGNKGNKEFGVVSPGANRDETHHLIEYLSIAGLILPRSGLGTKGLVLANTIGVIDEDYQGELMVSAWNSARDYRLVDCGCYYSGYDYNDELCQSCKGSGERVIKDYENVIRLKAGDRFAQLLFVPVIKAQFKVVDEFSNETSRGNGGFGSTS